MKLLIVDIDGTIADFTKRQKRAGPPPETGDRKLLQVWLDRLQTKKGILSDAPIVPILNVIESLQKTYDMDIVYLTGRSEKYRTATELWLKRVGAPSIPLFMRSNKDWRPPCDYKESVILKLIRDYKCKVGDVVTIDDDGSGDCEAMYKKLGILLLKVCR